MHDLKIHQYHSGRELPMDLLLLADPSVEMILSYINDCSLFIAAIDEADIACYALLPHDSILIEIKNLAVKESFQAKGIGTILIKHALQKAQESGYEKIRICTGNSSWGQLHLYKKLGFTEKRVIAGFFQENYPEPIFENEIECVDLIVLEKQL